MKKGSFPQAQTEGQPASNPFASSGFKFSSVGATTTSSTGSSLFSTASASSPTFTSVESNTDSTSKLFSSNIATSSTHQKNNDDLKIKFRALNEKFERKLSELVNSNLYGDYSSTVEKYLTFAKNIKTESTSSSSPALSNPTYTSSVPTPSFQFTPSLPSKASLSTTTSTTDSKPLFNFGANKTTEEQPENASSSKPEEVKEGKANDDRPADKELKFVFKPTDSVEPSPFVFNKTTTSDAEKKRDNKPGLTFKFVAPATKIESPFKFSEPAKKTESPFKSLAVATKESEEKKGDEPKPLFTSNLLFGTDKEGAKKIATENNHTWGPEKGINFNTKSLSSSDTESQKSFFANPVQPPTTTSALTNEGSKLFSFSSSANNNTVSENKPSLFGKTPAAPVTGGLFEKASSSSSVFSDSNTSNKSGLFGTTPTAPAFQFGSSSANKSAETKPLFGSTAGGSSGFGSFTSTTPAFSFSPAPAPAPASITTTAPSTASTNEEGSKEEGDGEVAAEESGESTNFTAQGPGEENEDSLYEKKAKVYSNAEGKLQAEGIGLLRVLKHKETKKSRVVVRADGGGRVLLNVLLHKGFSYKANKTLVTIVELTGDGPKQHMVRVKTAEDASELSKVLEDNK